MITMLLSELSWYLFGETVREPFVDSSLLSEKVRINLNISFYSIPCAAISLDHQDIMGAHNEDITTDLNKLRIDSKGNNLKEYDLTKIRARENIITRGSNPKLAQKDGKCGSCYGAEILEGQCCNSCDEVLECFRKRMWPAPPRGAIAQCMPNGKTTHKIIKNFQPSPMIEMLSELTQGQPSAQRLPRKALADVSSGEKLKGESGDVQFEDEKTAKEE